VNRSQGADGSKLNLGKGSLSSHTVELCGAADLHPGLDHSRILFLLNARGVPLRLATSGENVVTIWKSNQA